MGRLSAKKTVEALGLLKNYNGNSQYIKAIQYYTFIKKIKQPNEFELQYILRNHDFNPIEINKIVKVLDWWGEKKREEWNFQHPINKLKIIELLGETDSNYHVSMLYRQSQTEPVTCFIPKSVLLDDLIEIPDKYVNLDYTKYDNILSKIDRSVMEIQKQTCEFILNKKHCLIANEAGSGKTLAAILAAMEGGFKKILVICPATLKTNWSNELKMIDIPEEEIGIVNGTNWVYDKKYTIINYDIIDNFHVIPKVINDKGKEIKSRKKSDIQTLLETSELIKSNFDFIIIDEAHMLSNYKSNRSETINDFIDRCDDKHMVLMTGTPISNNVSMFFAILKILKHKVVDNYEEYMMRYASAMKIPKQGERDYWTEDYLKKVKKNTWYELTPEQKLDLKEHINKYAKKIIIAGKTPSNLDELYYRIKDCYLRLEKKDIGNISDKFIIENYYELTKEERVEYEQLWEQYENTQKELGNNNLNKDLTELMLLRAYVADKMVKNSIEFVESLISKGLKVFLVCTFTSELEYFVEHFGKSCVFYKGGMTTKKRDEAVRAFNEDDNIKVFVGNIIASNVGLSLHKKCWTSVFSSLSFSHSVVSQAIDRTHRLGSVEDVNIYVQMFKDTISEDIWSTVIKKELVTNALIKSENIKKLEK